MSWPVPETIVESGVGHDCGELALHVLPDRFVQLGQVGWDVVEGEPWTSTVIGTVGSGVVVRLARRLAAGGVVELFGVDEARGHGGYRGDHCLGLVGGELAAKQFGGAPVLVFGGAVDEDDAGDLVGVGGGEQLGDHATVGVADHHVRCGDGGCVEECCELVGHAGRVAGSGCVVAAATEDVGFVVAAHPGVSETGRWTSVQSLVRPPTRTTVGSPCPTQVRNSWRPSTLKRPVRGRGRERFGGRLVEGDRLDAMWWLGLDVEVEGRWFAGAGADEGDG